MQREQRQACLQPTPTTCNAPLFCRYTSQVFLKPGRQVISKVYDSTLFDHLDSTWDFAVGPAPTSTWLTFSVDFGFKSPLFRLIAAVFFEEVGCTALSVFCVCVELDVERVLRGFCAKGMCLSPHRLLAAYAQLSQKLLHIKGRCLSAISSGRLGQAAG